jgi:hypothetical protein
MAHFFRVVLTLLCCVGGAAMAALAPVPMYTTHYPPGSSFTSPYAACQAAVAYFGTQPHNADYNFSGAMVIGNGTGCQYDWKHKTLSNAGTSTVGIYSSGTSCPANSTKEGDQCVCAADFEEKDGQCRPKNPCPAGQHEEGGACVPNKCEPDEVRVNGVCVKEPPCEPGYTRINGVCKKNGCEPGKNMGSYVTDRDAVTYYCEDSCMIKVKPTVCVKWDGQMECEGTGYQTGAKCSGGGDGSGPGPDPSPDPGDPGNHGEPGNPGDPGGGDPGGGTPGGGTPGGGDPGSGDPGSGDPGTPGGGDPGSGDPGTPGGGDPGTTPDGGVSLPPPKPKDPLPEDDDDGDPDTFTCPDGYHPAPKGRACIMDPSPPDGDGKCPEGTVRINGMCHGTYNPNPGDPGGNGDGDGDGDGDESGWGGDCMSGFACEGDAIFCAIAKEQHRRACKLFDDKSAESDVYDAEAKKDALRDVTGDLPGNEEIDITGKLSRENVLGGGSCIQNLNIVVGGRAITLPMTEICPFLGYLGLILVAIASIAAARIITRA